MSCERKRENMKIKKINAWFALRGREKIQKRWWILGIFTLVFTKGLTGLKHFKVTASWEDYFLEDDPMLVKTDEFKAIFGNDNFIAVSCPSPSCSHVIQELPASYLLPVENT